MTGSNADGRRPLNPQALSVEHVAKILTASGRQPVTVETIRADIDGGAPINPDGTMNLVHYAAWLVKKGMAGDD